MGEWLRFHRSVGVANPATPVTALAGGGDWTVTTTAPDGTYTVTTYVGGCMDITEMFSSDKVLIVVVAATTGDGPATTSERPGSTA